MKTDCPLRCRRRYGAAPDHVNWAGFPVNLDLAFSQAQRDRVYIQHMKRAQGSQLWRWSDDGAQPCVCEIRG